MNHKSALRLFFGVDLSQTTKTRLIDFQSGIHGIGGRPVAANNFHITLSFLGQQPQKTLETILDQFTAPPLKPFEVTTQDLIYWNRPKVVALRVQDPKKRLSKLKGKIESQLNRLNIRNFDKRSFEPHITLFRRVEIPPQTNAFFDTTIAIQRITLFESVDTRDGVDYQPLADWPLAGLSIKQQLLGKE